MCSSDLIEVLPEDLVFDTNGSITDSTSIGDLDTAIAEDHRYAPSALLWKQAAGRFYTPSRCVTTGVACPSTSSPPPA